MSTSSKHTFVLCIMVYSCSYYNCLHNDDKRCVVHDKLHGKQYYKGLYLNGNSSYVRIISLLTVVASTFDILVNACRCIINRIKSYAYVIFYKRVTKVFSQL